MGDNRPAVYYDNTIGDHTVVMVIRASAIGNSCLYELVASGQGHEPMPVPDTLQRAFDEGNELEPVVIEMLKKMGLAFYSHQEEGHLWLSDDVVVRYHPDGIAQVTTTFIGQHMPILALSDYRSAVVEIKALSDPLWQQAKRGGVQSTIKEYQWQGSAMMLGEDMPLLWAIYNKGNPPDEDGKREPCADEGTIYLQWVEQPFVSLTELQLKASLIKYGVEGEDVTTSDMKCGDPTNWPCRYLHMRPEPEPEEQNADAKNIYINDETQADVDRLIQGYITYKGQAEEAKARQEDFKAKIIALAGDDPEVKKLLTDKWQVPIVRQQYAATDLDQLSPDERVVYENLRAKATVRKDKAPFLRGCEETRLMTFYEFAIYVKDWTAIALILTGLRWLWEDRYYGQDGTS